MEEVAEEKAQAQAMAGNWAEQLLYTDRWNPMSITEPQLRDITGNRNVLTSWDEDGNELDHEITIQEPVRLTFKTRAEAVAYAKKMKYKYMNL